MTAATKARKTTATKKAAPAARKTSPARTKPATKPVAKKAVAKKAPAATKVVAKKAPAATKVVAKKAPAKKPAATTRSVPVPRPRTKPVAVVAPVAPVAPVVVPAPRTRTQRPLVARAARRRTDGRALSYSERLEEAMHRQLKHTGAVCHQCRTNAARLAALVPAGGRLAG